MFVLRNKGSRRNNGHKKADIIGKKNESDLINWKFCPV